MSNLKLNETPLRTTRNYNINNIKLENVNIPEQIGEFKNVFITGANYKNNITTLKLTYGLSQELETQVANKSNQKIKIQVENSENAQIDFKFDKQNTRLVENIEIIAEQKSQRNNNNKIWINRKHRGLPQWNNKCNS